MTLLVPLSSTAADSVDPDSSSSPLERTTGETAHPRSLKEIRASGYIRILTRNNATSFFIYRGHRMGFDYELGKRLAQSLGVRAQFVVPSAWGDLIPSLLRGEGDVIAGELTITPERSRQVAFSSPYLTTVERVVYAKKSPKVSAPEDLSGKKVLVRRSSSYFQTLTELNTRLTGSGKAPAELVDAPEDIETEALLEQLGTGEAPYSIADELLANLVAGAHQELVVGPAVSDKRELGWAVRPKDEELLAAINAMFRAEKKAPEFNILKRKYFDTPRQLTVREKTLVKGGALSPYDALIQSAARKYGLDWRFLAAQIYQESQFDPRRQSWCGAQGLFQLMPGTAKEVGVSDSFDPKQSIEGGTKYVGKLLKEFADVADPDERYKLALASYNCGSGHVRDAQALARSRHQPPDSWAVVRAAMLDLTKEKVHGRTQYGYCRCGEPVAYVQKITERYDAYRQMVPEP
jgi:membrane-bound lytic murein transglycosylase F